MLSAYLCYVYMGAQICHVLAIYHRAEKFDGELNLHGGLVVGVETANA